jgi:uncharacterized YigZ family protein
MDTTQIQDSYKSIAAESKGLFKDNGSRFIAHAYPVETEEEVKEIVAALKKEYYDARHHVYAYRLGYKGDKFRANDDGEPSGSSGRPVLGQIDSCGLSDILVVVVRYFGGIKLGTGGLTRAYQNGVKEALPLLPVTEKKVLCRGLVEVDYAHVDRFYRLLPQYQARVAGEDFGASALFTVELPEDLFEACRDALREATDGASEMMDAGPATEDI